MVRGFEAGLVRFLRSRAVPHGPLRAFSDALRYALAPEKPQSALDRLVASGMPVLIIHGENDALVPLFNSRRLAAALPNCRLEVIPKCGHCPQEVRPGGGRGGFPRRPRCRFASGSGMRCPAPLHDKANAGFLRLILFALSSNPHRCRRRPSVSWSSSRAS